jgi:hypothetical protein
MSIPYQSNTLGEMLRISGFERHLHLSRSIEKNSKKMEKLFRKNGINTLYELT